MTYTPGVDDWFGQARLGLFVHWGIYSAAHREPSWPMVGPSLALPKSRPVSVAEYYAAADTFAPRPDAAREWIELGASAGMTYAVMTTKHHDGWTLFPSDHSSFGVTETLGGRDLVAEYVDACRAAGLRVGLYFSLPDWHHPDYPAWRDDMAPYGFVNLARSTPEAWSRFRADQEGQLRHLLTAYGTIDLLWFDGGWERSADEWGSADLSAMIHELQPGIVLNDRLPGVTGYATPEQAVPEVGPGEPWETCLTMGESWGLVDDDDRKSATELLLTMAEVAGRGGNLLLNVAPDGEGRLAAWQRERLEHVARWMAVNGDSISNTTAGLAAWQFPGPTTRRADRRVVYLICPMQPRDIVVLRGVPGRRIEQVRALATGEELPFDLRIGALDRVFNPDPACAVVIDVSGAALEGPLPVLEVSFTGPV
ncbi:MAG: alpha-L-fucosidase [Actinomycetota bacterium]|nr:alpha-L-fucosidase [Actinomycetota bacterium]